MRPNETKYGKLLDKAYFSFTRRNDPSRKTILQAAETKSRESKDHGSQLLTNALHDYRAERIMENLHWLLLVVVIGKGSGEGGGGGGSGRRRM